MYICIHTLYIYTYIHTYIRIYININIHIYVCIYVYMYAYVQCVYLSFVCFPPIWCRNSFLHILGFFETGRMRIGGTVCLCVCVQHGIQIQSLQLSLTHTHTTHTLHTSIWVHSSKYIRTCNSLSQGAREKEREKERERFLSQRIPNSFLKPLRSYHPFWDESRRWGWEGVTSQGWGCRSFFVF